MIKLIAFDLGWCLLTENDIELSYEEEILESKFWDINSDNDFYSWASKTLSLSENEIKNIISKFIVNLYSLRDKDIFEKILVKYPDISFAVAGNHISQVNECLNNLWVNDACDTIVISWECWEEKPTKEFFNVLIEKSWCSPKEILFVDDSLENIVWATRAWLNTLHYTRWTCLSDCILSYLEYIRLFH